VLPEDYPEGDGFTYTVLKGRSDARARGRLYSLKGRPVTYDPKRSYPYAYAAVVILTDLPPCGPPACSDGMYATFHKARFDARCKTRPSCEAMLASMFDATFW
jgi:hypothetical protein